MTITTLTPLPTAPDPDDPSTFDAKADAFVAALPTLVTDFNGNVTALNQVGDDADTALAASNFVGTWASQTGAATVPTAVAHNSAFWMLLNDVADITATEPGVTADWQQIAVYSSGALTRSARTSNTILGVSDNGTLIDFTANTFTQTLTAAATLGAGWFCYLKNSGTGDITLDPNGSETIDGETTKILYPGEQLVLMCDGSNFYTVIKPTRTVSWLEGADFSSDSFYEIDLTEYSEYQTFRVVFENLEPASASAIWIGLSNSTTYSARAGRSSMTSCDGSSVSAQSQASTNALRLTGTNSVGNDCSGTCEIIAAHESSVPTSAVWHASNRSGTTVYEVSGSLVQDNNEVTAAIRITTGAANIFAGRVDIYGVKNS